MTPFLHILRLVSYSLFCIIAAACPCAMVLTRLMVVQSVAIAHADVFAPMWRITQKRFEAAIAFLRVFPKHQACEELGERKVLPTELAGVGRQNQSGHVMGHPHHPPWRFAVYHPALCNR
jgi:hypothetical protein